MENISLKKVLSVFLYEVCEDIDDISFRENDNEFINTMIDYLSKDDVCPFKNYEATVFCSGKCGNDRLKVDCGRDNENVWKYFISENEKD